MQEQITQLHLEILALCFAVKAKGHDAFYRHSAHVNWSEVDIHLNGWDSINPEPDISYGGLKTVIDRYDSAESTINKLTECKEYLESLLND